MANFLTTSLGVGVQGTQKYLIREFASPKQHVVDHFKNTISANDKKLIKPLIIDTHYVYLNVDMRTIITNV